MPTKAGYVSIVGKPNVGKSTLINAIIGSKLSIVTPKPQTTRKNVLGIYTTETVQIIFTDTPGYVKPRYELHKSMVNSIIESIKGSDIVLVLCDISCREGTDTYFSKDFLDSIRKSRKPLILAINKIDLLENKKEILPLIDFFNKLQIFTDIIPVSALKHISIDGLINTTEKYLPESPYLYEPEFISTQNERFFVSEIIRQQIFLSYGEEVPYSAEVIISEFKERQSGKWYISADIVVEKDSHKKIMIGSKGSKIKSLGESSRSKIEEFLNQPVYLKLFVKVRPNWRQNKTLLKSFGY
jgi:GTP-binding protein Era